MLKNKGEKMEEDSYEFFDNAMCNTEDCAKWDKGEILFFDFEKFYTREDAIRNLKESQSFAEMPSDFDLENEEAVNENLKLEGYQTREQYYRSEYERYWEDQCPTDSTITIESDII